MADSVTNSNQFDYNLFGQKVEQAKSQLNTLNTKQKQLEGKEAELNQGINSADNTVKNEQSIAQQYGNLIMQKEAENPLLQPYKVLEFVVDNSGMCGMGMGMGGFCECGPSITLTGQELLDISSLFKANKDGQYSPSQLAEQLKEKGYNVEADDTALGNSDGNGGTKAALTLTRSDGSKVEFKDANGDGMLNGCDYDFDTALNQLSNDMDVYLKEMNELEAKMDEHLQAAEVAQAEEDALETELGGVEQEEEKIKAEITDTTYQLYNALDKQTRAEKLAKLQEAMDAAKESGVDNDDKKKFLEDIIHAHVTSLNFANLNNENISDLQTEWNDSLQWAMQYAQDNGIENFEVTEKPTFM